MIILIIFLVSFIFSIFCNIYVAKTMSIEEMHEDFFQEQYLIGKILANIFYFPAWIYKILNKLKIERSNYHG